ncbi:MAG: hypothetical protein ACTTKZ_02105 [Bacteroides sp.]
MVKQIVLSGVCVLVAFGLFSCSKDKDSNPALEVAGVYKAKIETIEDDNAETFERRIAVQTAGKNAIVFERIFCKVKKSKRDEYTLEYAGEKEYVDGDTKVTIEANGTYSIKNKELKLEYSYVRRYQHQGKEKAKIFKSTTTATKQV